MTLSRTVCTTLDDPTDKTQVSCAHIKLIRDDTDWSYLPFASYWSEQRSSTGWFAYVSHV